MLSLICGIITLKSRTHRNRIEKWFPEARGWGKQEEVGKGYKLSIIR